MTESLSSSDLSGGALPAAPPRSRLGFILLAAGSSTRMGRAKQLLVYRGTPLIVRAINAMIEDGASPVIVVLGARAPEIRAVIEQLPITIVENASWEEGMGSSIRLGLGTMIEKFPPCDAVGLAVCDQPHFSSSVIGGLRAELRGEKTIACARYAGRSGVPALFSAQHFAELRKLGGGEGARQLIATHAPEVATVEFPELAVDLDTLSDYERLLARESAP